MRPNAPAPAALLFGSLPIVIYLALGWALHRTHGHYSPGYACLLGALSALFLVRFFPRFRFVLPAAPLPRLFLAATVLLFALRLWHDPDLEYAHQAPLWPVLRLALGALVVSSASLFLLAFVAPRSLLARLNFAAAFATIYLSKWLVLFLSPSPRIDVFTNSTLAARYLLAGENPYTQTYPDIYQGASGYLSAFSYWPGTLLWMTPFQALFGDVRVAFLTADALAVWMLYRLARRVGVDAWCAELLALSWAVFPVTLFVVEQAWTDPLLIFLAVLAAFYLREGRWRLGGLVLGWLLAAKQYTLPVLLASFAWTTAASGLAAAATLLGFSLLAGTAILMPFVIWNVEGFYRSTVTLLTGQAFRADSLSLSAFAREGLKLSLSPVVTWGIPLLVAASVAGALWRERRFALRQWAFGLFTFYLFFFLFARQAFCNYYVFTACFCVLGLTLEWPSSHGEMDN